MTPRGDHQASEKPTEGIHIVWVERGGICARCGNGLFPGPPCEHRKEAESSTQDKEE